MEFVVALSFVWLFGFGSCGVLNYDELQQLWSIKKRENAEDFEQCAPVSFPVGQLGVVNVIAFLDNSWGYSHKQAAMLKLLKDRLQRSGLPPSLFFAILSESPPNSMEEEIEKEAWENVAPDEALELSSGLMTFESLKTSISPDIFVIEDTEGIWKNFHSSRDQVLVIDRCGKLAYQVIVPWSILHFPYVKAAILSTHNDDPCGVCDSYATVLEFDGVTEGLEELNSTETPEELPWEEGETTTIDPDTNLDELLGFEERNGSGEVTEHEDEFLPSLRIIMHAPHVHMNADSKKRHEYLVVESDKPDYHGHLDVLDSEGLIPEEKVEDNVLESIVFEKDESPGLYGEVADFWRDMGEEMSDTLSSEHEDDVVSTTPGDMMDEGVTNYGDFTVEEEESRSKLIAHYSRLLPWIYYILDK